MHVTFNYFISHFWCKLPFKSDKLGCKCSDSRALPSDMRKAVISPDIRVAGPDAVVLRSDI